MPLWLSEKLFPGVAADQIVRTPPLSVADVHATWIVGAGTIGAM